MSQSGSAVSSVLQLLQLLVIAYCVTAQLPVCGPPRVPAYGGYHGIATPPYVLGSVANYYCNPGYQLHGSSRTECIFDPLRGPHWLYPPPFCRPFVDCGKLPTPHFSRVVLTETTFGSTATYSCQVGYILVGGSIRTCQASGQWSGQAPVCNIVDCGNLLNPRFGKVVLTGTTFGSTCTYSCQVGYTLVGGSTRTCQANGHWSGVAPVCNFASCGVLPNPHFGKVVLTETTVGFTATYSCQRGYILAGRSIRTCQAIGQWSGQAPVCNIVDCGNLLNPRFGKVVLTGTTFGSTCTYSCQVGYILVGGSSRTCLANGHWSGVAPVCNIASCGVLPNPHFGKVVLTETTVGFTATYSCQRGYILAGRSIRTCQANGPWSGQAPVCNIVDCGNLLNPRFGKVVLTGTTFGSTCTYSCQVGYILVGGSTRTCQASGHWSGVSPVCKVVDCGLTLRAPTNGFVSIPCTSLGCTTTFSCRSGYGLVGPKTRICLPNGYWSNETPICLLY